MIWSDLRPADRAQVMAELSRPGRFGHAARITLVYPGCGWDFGSFWGPTDPAVAVMLDPAPITLSDEPQSSIAEWKYKLSQQLDVVQSTRFEDFVFDYERNEARPLRGDDWQNIGSQDFEIVGPLRPAFSTIVKVRESGRTVIFIAARYQELPVLQGMSVSTSLDLYRGMPAKAHIVYEHKSMIPASELQRGVAEGGCLIWGLPEDAPNVQWSLPG